MCIYDKFVDLRYDRKNNIENGKINKTGRGCDALDLADRPCFIKDILAKYEEPKPPYTTLASIVKNLERKKYVKAKRYGNTYEYRPLIPQEEYKRTFMGSVVNNYFENSYKEMSPSLLRNRRFRLMS